MRSITSIALFLLALCTPAGALAGTFAVAFGGGTPMLAAGWTPKPDAGGVCAYEGTGTVFLNAGTLAAHSGCLYLFNAPASAQILAVNVALSYAKASPATGLCAYSFGALPGDTMRHCTGGAFGNAIAASGANWVELGLYNESASPIGIATARANNVVFTSGWVTLSDPSAPELVAIGPTGLQTGLSATLNWAATDRESGSPSVSYAIDGGARVAIRGQACSWLCGTAVGGSVPVDLGALADGPHSITVYSQSYADAGSSVGPLPFSVDRTAPGQPGIRVEPDAAAPASGWWGHGPVALTISSPAADVASSAVSAYGPSGALVFQAGFSGAVTSASVPASAFAAAGAYEIEVVECDAAGHCTASPRAGLHWDASPPAAAADGFAAPLGAIAGRDGAHIAWPAAAGAAGASGIAGGFLGIGPSAASARAQALASATPVAGLPGVSEAAVPAALVHGADRVCLAVRLRSGAGIPAAAAGVRCAAIDELPPEIALGAGLAWSGGTQTLALAASDASGAGFSQVLVDGAPIADPGDSISISGEGAHVLRVVARDGAGNETVAERGLGVDATAPSIGRVAADFLAREVRVDVADALSGVARVEVRLAGTVLETRLAADGRTAIARVPDGLALDGAVVAVRALDASVPANAGELATSLPVRPLPVLAGLDVSGGHVTGRVVAAAPAARVEVWASPKGRAPLLLGAYATRSDGSFTVPITPRRTTRYAVTVPESQFLRGLPERVAGSVRVTARITGLRLRVHGDRLAVRARFGGRGEATRLHLLVHDVRGGRWVEACLEHGRPGVRLERTGRVWGTCRIPPSARGRAWTYRLVLAAPSSAWPWRTPSSASSSVLLPL